MSDVNRRDADRALLLDPRVPVEHRLALLDVAGPPGDPTALLHALLARTSLRPAFREGEHSQTLTLARRLVELGADPFSQQPDALDRALDLGYGLWAAELLGRPDAPSVRHRQVPLVRDERERGNWLHAACARNLPTLVQSLLAHGFDANEPDAQGTAPLLLAKDVEVVRALLEAGATPTLVPPGETKASDLALRFSGWSLAERQQILPTLQRQAQHSERQAFHIQGLAQALLQSELSEWTLHHSALPKQALVEARVPDGSKNKTLVTPLRAAAFQALLRKNKRAFSWDMWARLTHDAPDAWLVEGTDGAMALLAVHDRAHRGPHPQAAGVLVAWQRRWNALWSPDEGFGRLVDASLAFQTHPHPGAIEALTRAWQRHWEEFSGQFHLSQATQRLAELRATEPHLARLLRHSKGQITRTFSPSRALEHNPGLWVAHGEGAMALRLMGYLAGATDSKHWVDDAIAAGARWDDSHPLAAGAREAWGTAPPRSLERMWRAQDAARELVQSLPEAHPAGRQNRVRL